MLSSRLQESAPPPVNPSSWAGFKPQGMTPNGSMTRRLRTGPSYDVWKPSDGQSQAVLHLIKRPVAAIWADPGAGKTSITLSAFVALQKAKLVRKMLVIAPLKVCQLVWRQEAAKWEHTKHLKVVLLHGDKKDALLKEDADIYLVNYDGIAWLTAKFFGRPLPFDVVVCDEITKIKNSRTDRSKKLLARSGSIRYKWGLTGTPAPNGYLNLFGQFLWLDGGASLGKYFTHYRDNYFKPDYDGFNYTLQHGAEDRIHKAIANIVFRLSYTDLPEHRVDERIIKLDGAARKAYDTMKRDMVLQTKDGLVTAANAASTYAKLKQMANGAVYLSGVAEGPNRPYAVIHDEKLEALGDLVEELQGQPLLVAYEFHHDAERITKYLADRFGKERFCNYGKVENLGSKTSEKEAIRIQDDWNGNRIPVLLAHPASVGHGLNLQQGGASHLCWFSPHWDLELYDQFIRRIWRKGNTAAHVIEHRLIVEGSIDELVFDALEDKDATQSRLLSGVALLLQGNPSGGARRQPQEATMAIRRLGTQEQPATGNQPPQQSQNAPPPKPAGGLPAGWVAQKPATSGQGAATVQQGNSIQSKLQGGNAPSTYVAPPQEQVEEQEGEMNDAAQAMFNAALNGTDQIQGGEEQPQEVQQAAPLVDRDITNRPDNRGGVNVGTGTEAKAAPKATKPRAVKSAEDQRVNVESEDNVKFAPHAYPPLAGAQVHISFNGSAAEVAAAMQNLIAAFKAA